MTLLEVVLALALMVLLGSFVVGVLRSVLGIWQASERRGRGDLVFLATVEQFRRDLGALHTGPRGWLVLDDWRARAAGEEEPEWRLPRLRFLARGENLPLDDPGGERAVEIAWLLVPEDAAASRLCRLVRIAQPEGAGASLLERGRLEELLRQGAGLTVLDGVAWLEFAAEDPAGAAGGEVRALRVEPDRPDDFPRRLSLRLERVAGRARSHPPRLDGEVSDAAGRLLLRGSAPLAAGDHLLIGREWIEVGGAFPSFTVRQRGARGSVAADHPRGAPVWLPQAWSASWRLPADGRRLQP
ncbi:MAG: hypothetical protein D6702_02170 [Planctomycetota bacterium]|nr:MAG: hypothetical protein D6702_02170 [Planctomycetota bacterium]